MFVSLSVARSELVCDFGPLTEHGKHEARCPKLEPRARDRAADLLECHDELTWSFVLYKVKKAKLKSSKVKQGQAIHHTRDMCFDYA